MQPILTSRRNVLKLAVASLLPASMGYAADNDISFDQLYASHGVLGLQFSEKILGLSGKQIAMRGFMAPPLKAEANFFVLTKIPVSLCPFCDSDADWPDDIVVIYLRKAQTFEQANGEIEVRGVLETGSWTDPDTGFVSLLRIVSANFRKA